jgi:AcrR family transcriptional regulator
MADRASRKKRITAQRRAQILKAGTEVFIRKGFTAATVPEIARAAGVAVGTVYLYFPSKRDLFIAAINNIIINAPLLDLINRIPRENMAVVFGQIMQNRFDLLQGEEMSRMPALMGEVLRDPELKAILNRDFLKPLLTQVEGIYRAMQPPGEPLRTEPAVAVRAVAGLIIGSLMLRLLEGESSPMAHLPREKVAVDMVNFILYGLSGADKDMKREKE